MRGTMGPTRNCCFQSWGRLKAGTGFVLLVAPSVGGRTVTRGSTRYACRLDGHWRGVWRCCHWRCVLARARRTRPAVPRKDWSRQCCSTTSPWSRSSCLRGRAWGCSASRFWPVVLAHTGLAAWCVAACRGEASKRSGLERNLRLTTRCPGLPSGSVAARTDMFKVAASSEKSVIKGK